MVLLLDNQQTSENQRFSDIFRGCKERTLAENVLSNSKSSETLNSNGILKKCFDKSDDIANRFSIICIFEKFFAMFLKIYNSLAADF